MSDRITVYTHFEDQSSQLLSGVIRVLILLIHVSNRNQTIVDHEQIHFTPELDDLRIKQKLYLVYPRPHQLRSNTSRYEVRFEAYHVIDDESIKFLGVWLYPVVFNFLPSQRIVKVLTYVSPNSLSTDHICLSKQNPCLNSGICRPIMNQMHENESYWCGCSSNSYGLQCEFTDDLRCLKSNYCSPKSLCRPRHSQKPICICPISSFSPRCYVDQICYGNLTSKPCLNGGRCFADYKEGNQVLTYFICVCPKSHTGIRCQDLAATIKIKYNSTDLYKTLSGQAIRATVIQLLEITAKEGLSLKKQHLYTDKFPTETILITDQPSNPPIGLVKLYTDESKNDYHLLYTTSNKTTKLNLTLVLDVTNHCRHTDDIFQIQNRTESGNYTHS